ncbi:MAG: hypothetical protein R3A78_05305 [Polyangiales bacterium]
MRRFRCWALLAFALVGACDETRAATEVVLVIDTDLRRPPSGSAEFDTVTIRIARSADDEGETRSFLASMVEWPIVLPVVPKSGASTMYADVTARLGEREVVRRAQTIRFAKERRVRFDMTLFRACADEACDDTYTCNANDGTPTCGEPVIDGKDLPRWAGAEPRDGGGEDAPTNAGPCPAPDDDTIALYEFEDTSTSLTDSAGNLDGSHFGPVNLEDGPSPECGQAIQSTRSGGDIWLGDIPNYDPIIDEVRAIDFWVRLPAPPSATVRSMAILNRAADANVQPGHFGVHWSADSRIFARIQMEGVDEFQQYICSHVLTPGWTHVTIGVDPDGIRMFVNGIPATVTGAEVAHDGDNTGAKPCTAGPLPNLLDQNHNQWVLGGATDYTAEGAFEPMKISKAILTGAAIDHLRFSRAPR